MMASSVQPTTADEHNKLANEFLKNKNYNAAASHYVEASNINPANPTYLSNLSFVHFTMKDYEQALYYAQCAITIDPKFLKGYYRRALAKMKLMKPQEAKADLLMLTKYLPNDADVKAQLDKCNAIIKEILFFEAIKVDLFEFNMEYINTLTTPETYDGPIFNEPLSMDFVKSMIHRFKADKLIDKKSALLIMLKAKEILEKQETLINIQVPKGSTITVCGDVHGQFFDFIEIFDKISGYPSENHFYLFNGDFVDRGVYSVEIVLTLFAFKILYPTKFFLARGNHEFPMLNKIYGFETEVIKKFDMSMMPIFTQVFATLPICHVINDKIFVTHGGLPENGNTTLEEIKKIDRFSGVTPKSLYEALLWSDPKPDNGVLPSHRGAGVLFGPDITAQFLATNNLTHVIRSHEYKDQGYEIMHGGKLITIFSAPNYYETVSKGAVINIDSDCKMDFVQFSASLTQGKRSK